MVSFSCFVRVVFDVIRRVFVLWIFRGGVFSTGFVFRFWFT